MTSRSGAAAGAALAVAWAIAACGDGASKPRPPREPRLPPIETPVQRDPPVTLGAYRFHGPPQGVEGDVQDVSPDEGGNVWVAASSSVLVRPAGARDFHVFTLDEAKLSRTCHEEAELRIAAPVSPARACPAISVAGLDAGRAIVGTKGVGTDSDDDARWALRSGGADVLRLDTSGLTPRLDRERHVLVAAPPGVACEAWDNSDPSVPHNSVCKDTWDGSIWASGRLKMRQIQRIAVNHDRSRPLSYLDAYLGGTHGSLAILAAHPTERGMVDTTRGDPAWFDTRGVWEHHHPDVWRGASLLTGSSWAVALDPISNVPWYANQFRIASLQGYARDPAPTAVGAWWGDQVPGGEHLWIWAKEADPQDPARNDAISSLAFCDDGTLWVASEAHGLARVRLDRTRLEDLAAGYAIDRIAVPAGAGGALAVACDPADGSVWVGFAWGGFGRWKDGWRTVPAQGDVPGYARGPVRSIQIDRWSTPRTVWMAHLASRLGPAGVTAYDGP